MPIITIQSKPPMNAATVRALLLETRDRGAEALGSSVENLWVSFKAVESENFIQGTRAEPSPVVTIQANAGRTSEVREALVKAVTSVVSRVLEVSEAEVWT